MSHLPFQDLTLSDIQRVIELCQGIRNHYREKYPSGFYSIDDCMNDVPPLQQLELDQLYRSLSPVALQELIALKVFGNRGTVRRNHWQRDLQDAARLITEPHVLEGAFIGENLRWGLRNMMRVGLIDSDPLN